MTSSTNKTGVISLIFALMALDAIPQTLDPSVAYASGDVFTVYTDPSISIATTIGTGQTWDFSSASNATSSLVGVNASADVMPSVASLFPSATVFVVHDQADVYNAIQINANEMLDMGSSAPFIPFDQVYFNPKKILEFPGTLSTFWTDDYSGVQVGDLGTNVVDGDVSGTVNGHGTLYMPYGPVMNVFRVSVLDAFTTTNNGMTTGGGSYERVFFYKPGVRYPIVTTHEDLGAASSTSMSWIDASTVGIQETLQQTIGVDLMPNPASDIVQVQFGTEGVVHIDVLDLHGKIVTQQQVGPLPNGVHNYSLNVSQFDHGVYLLRVSNLNGESGTRRLVVF